MHCPRCGFETPAGMNFCGRYGTRFSPRCPNCDFENPPGFAFCGKCGADLAEPTPAAQSPSFTGTTSRLQTPIPAHLAEVGAFAEGHAIGTEGLQLAEAVEHPGSRVLAYFSLGLLSEMCTKAH
jgi:Double zinc ribbon